MTALPLLTLILAPLLGAVLAFARPSIAWRATAAVLALEAGLLLRGPTGSVSLVGTHLELTPLGRLALLAALATVVLASLSAGLRAGSSTAYPEPDPRGGPRARRPEIGKTRQRGRRLGSPAVEDGRAASPAVPAALGLATAALLARDSLPLAMLLLESAALALAFALVRSRAGAASAAARYVVIVTLAILALLLGVLLLGSTGVLEAGLTRVGAALVVVGLAILLAAFPFHLWLPGLAVEAEPEDGALPLALITGAAVALAVEQLRALPAAPSGQAIGPLVMSAGIASAGIAGVLALAAAPTPARSLAFLASSSLGFALVGLSCESDVGLVGALFTVLLTPPAFLLGLICLREASGRADEMSGRNRSESGRDGLATRPVLAVGLAVSALALAGAPPLAGFPGRWGVYVAMASAGDGYLAGSLVAAMLGVMAAGRLSYRTLSRGTQTRDRRWPREVTVPIVLILFLVVLGLWPAPVVDALQAALARLGAVGR